MVVGIEFLCYNQLSSLSGNSAATNYAHSATAATRKTTREKKTEYMYIYIYIHTAVRGFTVQERSDEENSALKKSGRKNALFLTKK